MNTLTATVEFDYKGKCYHLSALIDVDNFIAHEDFYQSVYLTIAKENNIGLYTYELEIMMDQTIVFSDEKGYCVGCVDQGVLDIECLKNSHKKHLCQPIVNDIINKHALDKDDKIVKALTDAYLQGKGS